MSTASRSATASWLIAKRVCSFDWVYSIPHNRNDSPFREAEGSFFPEDYTTGSRSRDDITYTGV